MNPALVQGLRELGHQAEGLQRDEGREGCG
jgi:hypothetical protein